MTPGLLSRHGRNSIAACVVLLAGAAWAQAPGQPLSQPERTKLRQPTHSSVQQKDVPQTQADKGGSEADRKVREMDRRLNRTLRSVCIGC